MLEKLSSFDEIWTKPLWIGIFSVIISVLLYLIYVRLVGMNDFEEGLLPTILIPAIVGPICSKFIGQYVKKIKRQNQKLAELNTTNRKLLSVIAHDVRSPLIQTKGFMELQFLGTLSSNEYKKLGQELIQQIDRVLELQNSLLEWANRKEGVTPITFERFNIEPIIKNTIKLYNEKLTKKGLNLNIKDINSLVYTDQDIFSFAFRNLYHNAIKFTANGGVITIQSIKSEQYYNISIEDSGIGLTKEEISKILDPSTYFTKIGTAKEKGSGFGINAVINYLKDCNGYLQINSKPNHGSCFTICLPLKK